MGGLYCKGDNEPYVSHRVCAGEDSLESGFIPLKATKAGRATLLPLNTFFVLVDFSILR